MAEAKPELKKDTTCRCGTESRRSTRCGCAPRGLERDLRQFLPPSLEVLETPPHPAPRLLLLLVVVIFATGVIWAILGKADIITSAEGKIIPGGRVRVIQPFDRGVVGRIMVAEGQLVKAGDALVELDQAQTKAEQQRLSSEMDYVTRRLARRKILAQILRNPEEEEFTLQDAREHPGMKDCREDAGLLYEEWHSLVSETRTLMSQLIERESELRTSQAIVRQYEATLPLIEKRVNAIKPLYELGISSMLDYLALEEERLRQVHALEAEKSRAEQLTAAVRSMQRQIAGQRSRNLAEVMAEADDMARQKKSLEQELAKTVDLGSKQILTSPVSGTVKGLAIHTVGGVVNPAEVLMEVVPLGERLEVEAFVGNQDIGYVHEGQTAEVKIHTFPFTRYGVIAAKVESVARDATVDEKQGLIYRTKLVLEKSEIMVNGRETPLLPGMAVTAEIATDQRRLIEFFLAPLLRMKQESLRER